MFFDISPILKMLFKSIENWFQIDHKSIKNRTKSYQKNDIKNDAIFECLLTSIFDGFLSVLIPKLELKSDQKSIGKRPPTPQEPPRSRRAFLGRSWGAFGLPQRPPRTPKNPQEPPKNHLSVLFERPVWASCLSVLFERPIWAPYFSVLFQRPISASYLSVLF